MNYTNTVFEDLKHVYLRNTKYIKLSHRYKPLNTNPKVLIQDVEVKFNDTKLSVSDFIYSVFKYTIKLYMMLQNHNVIWDSVSITYPTLTDSKYDLIKLPLTGVTGQVVPKDKSSALCILEHNLRFTGQPKAITKKIYGVELTELRNLEQLLLSTSQIYKQHYPIDNTNCFFRLVHPYMVKQEAKNKRKALVQKKYSYKKPYFSITRITT